MFEGRRGGRNSEELRLKSEANEKASLKSEEEARFAEELRLKSKKQEQARLKAEEETCLADELRLNADAGGFYGAGVERGY